MMKLLPSLHPLIMRCKALFKPLFKSKSHPIKVIFIGIDYRCFSLSKALLDNNHHHSKAIEITAFIDDEPWNNRTQVHQVTVYSPSEIAALVVKHQVDLIIQIEGESLLIADNIWQGIHKTGVDVLTLSLDQDLAQQQDLIYQTRH
ncbi:nucleoside-diphosphate sugar epimerase/dehydratase [Marinomonas aquiplantarum]|uniref:Uncharacterized protein n=1 Tax=Marinomonas aquiplantarum TaxID=491951 RepID=A0A366CWI5_9GAMM|nr:hypothetical protein [Marinomonas aquiplantarum]RBO82202.1 hypothetical protein DFP76_10630 [Marinomonas aquiplantarum]